MLALVAAFEAFLAVHDDDFAEGSAADWKRSRLAASREAVDADVLCFGSSLLKFGLMPEMIEGQTGLRAFNLSVLGGQTPSSYFLLRRALKAGARPRLILVDNQDMPSKSGFDVRGLSLPLHIRCWPELLDPREALELAWSARDPSFFGAVMARKLPSFKSRREVCGELYKWVRKGLTNARVQHYITGRNWRIHRGSILMPLKPSNLTKVTPEQMALAPCEWTLDPITSEYMGKFLRLASERGIPVIYLIPPTSPEHEGLRVRVGQHEQTTRSAREFQAQFPGLLVADARTSGYDRSVFVDDSHLAKPGAIAYSRDVAEVAARALAPAGAGPSWVELPRCRPRPGSEEFEDTEQSRVAIKAFVRTAR
jgi:hypothetical protein